jgi:hypothetical protein
MLAVHLAPKKKHHLLPSTQCIEMNISLINPKRKQKMEGSQAVGCIIKTSTCPFVNPVVSESLSARLTTAYSSRPESRLLSFGYLRRVELV